ncbi:MAG TPA: NAD(P)H-dependent glycerol-3-phosphate dehydrogenase [Solirubrobacteraceae bacterium]|nr:NAD(P)H-dependent glycerol-3-phosphate dehydrogenase [Solirubrobacteraceae bacterium]
MRGLPGHLARRDELTPETRQERVAVVGGGSWGTTVASITARNVPTILWTRRPEIAEEIERDHTNTAYLGVEQLHPHLRATSSLEEAVSEADVLVMAVPSHGFRSVLERAAPHVRPWVPIVSLTKGLELDTRRRMTEIVEELLPGHPAGVLAGPNLAQEVLGGYAAAAVLAMPDAHVARALQDIFRRTLFRVYASTDVTGVEIAGALKNVFAIAAGMASGLGTGDNTRALVISRSLAEMTRLGVAMGGERHTFAGLAGMGDLLATCISPLSRNRRVGEELARGRGIDEIVADMNMVAEGIKTSRVVMELGERHGVETPIAREVFGVVHEGRTPEEAYRGLFKTRPTTELAAN